jgi:thiol:disulfide interchange protein
MPMHRIALAAVFVVVGCSKKSDESSQSAPSATATVGWTEADPKQPLDAQLAEQAQLAVKAGKKPHAYLHASWCGPCVAIEKTRKADPKMQAAFAGTHIIAIDIDATPADQLEKLELESAVIPIFYRLDDTGHPTGATIDGGAWGDNIPENMAPPLTAFFAK